jgi:hypothetical protein
MIRMNQKFKERILEMKERIFTVVNVSIVRNNRIALFVAFGTALVVGSLPAMAQTNGDPTPETIIGADPFPTESGIDVSSVYLDATEFNDHYTELMQRTQLIALDREVAILLIEIHNLLDTTVTTSLADIGVYAGSMRLSPVIFLFDEVGNGKIATYQLIGNREFDIHGGQRMCLHLVFVIRPGEDIFVANASVYALFKHASVEGLPFSVSIGRRIDTPVAAQQSNGFDPDSGQPASQPKFLIAPQVTPDSIFRVRNQGIPLLPDQSGLREFLGERGRRGTDPVFLGVPLAIKDGDFDYMSAISFLEEFYDFYESHNDVERLVTWMPKYRLLFSVIHEKALFGVEIHGPISTPTDVASALFFVGTYARDLGIDKTHLAPIKYVEQAQGFSVECLGVHVEGTRQGNVYTLDLYKKDSGGSREQESFKTLEYVRSFEPNRRKVNPLP